MEVGDLITYIVGWQQLSGDVYIARACDNRIGTFVAAEVLRLCAKAGKKLKASVVAASAVGEENGLYGAHMLGYSVHPDAALVIDVGQATDIPITNKKKFGDVKLGKGPILSRGSVNHPVLVRRLEDVAKKHKIDFQRGIDPRYSGTDADAIFLQRGGIATAAIGVPNRYMHTPVEAVHLGRPGETGRVALPLHPRSLAAGEFQGEGVSVDNVAAVYDRRTYSGSTSVTDRR